MARLSCYFVSIGNSIYLLKSLVQGWPIHATSRSGLLSVADCKGSVWVADSGFLPPSVHNELLCAGLSMTQVLLHTHSSMKQFVPLLTELLTHGLETWTCLFTGNAARFQGSVQGARYGLGFVVAQVMSFLPQPLASTQYNHSFKEQDWRRYHTFYVTAKCLGDTVSC